MLVSKWGFLVNNNIILGNCMTFRHLLTLRHLHRDIFRNKIRCINIKQNLWNYIILSALISIKMSTLIWMRNSLIMTTFLVRVECRLRKRPPPWVIPEGGGTPSNIIGWSNQLNHQEGQLILDLRSKDGLNIGGWRKTWDLSKCTRGINIYRLIAAPTLPV